MNLSTCANIFARLDAHKPPRLWRLCDIVSAKTDLPLLDNIIVSVGGDPCIYEKEDRQDSDFGEALHIPYCIASFMSDKELQVWLHLFFTNMKYGYDVLPGKNYVNKELIDLDIHEFEQVLAAEHGKLELWTTRVKGHVLRCLWADYTGSISYFETLRSEPWLALQRFKTAYLPPTPALIRKSLESGTLREQYWSNLPEALAANNVDMGAIITGITCSEFSNSVIDANDPYIEKGITEIFTNEWLLMKSAKAA